MNRRDFLMWRRCRVATVLMGANEALAQNGAAKGMPGAQGATAATPKMSFKTRPAKVEILFKAPGLSGNGRQVTDEGIWTIDIAGSRGETPDRCKVYLSSFDGKLIRELAPEGTGPSGLGHDGKSIWIGSTYSREIIRADAKTGETMEKHFAPGAGVIYRRSTDVPARPDTYGQKARAEAAAARGETVPARRGPRRGRDKTPGRGRVMVSGSGAAARSPAIPGLRRRAPARMAFRPRAASCGSRSLRGA